MGVKQTTICRTAALGLLLAILAQAPLAAQQPTADQTAAIRQSCRSDFMANCSGVKPGGADALACLKRNVAKLSGACQTAVSAVMPAAAPAAVPAAASPAPATAPQPTTAAPPPAARPATAVKPATAPAAKLNPPPPPPPAAAAAVPPLNPRPFIMPGRRLAIEGICRTDAMTLCAGTPPIGKQLIDCLAAQAPSLSRQCYDAIARVSR